MNNLKDTNTSPENLERKTLHEEMLFAKTIRARNKFFFKLCKSLFEA